jgi:hypothetical protein
LTGGSPNIERIKRQVEAEHIHHRLDRLQAERSLPVLPQQPLQLRQRQPALAGQAG